ncbi:hypothetical protein [Abyssibacter sp.]|uniref:hypothetical protein n=1 Tax=Abyssibacter sp. TaxID=2320200 RepID=UPI0025BEF178|nr:hypothetical protein [Abyssibacter sp.]MCK5860339.1 hypothetical protein [Abyssibacter sp.]
MSYQITGRFLSRALLSMVALFGISGCSDGEPQAGHVPSPDVSRFPQCGSTDKEPFTGSAPPATTIAINEQLPAGLDVQCYDEIVFDAEGDSVTLVHLVYGEIRGDGLADYSASDLCALVSSDTSALYATLYYDDSERPVQVTATCKDSVAPDSNLESASVECRAQIPGRTHPVTETDEWANFVQDQETPYQRYSFCFSSTRPPSFEK